MRWIWIDKIVEHDVGRRMVAIKNVSRAEQHLRDHFPGNPVMPASLIIEGMAQTAGILVGGANDFKEKVILAKIVRATLDADVVPGQSLRYTATVERLDRQGCSTLGTVERFARPATAWQEIGRIDLIFSHLDQNASGLRFPEENFVFTDEIFSLLADM